MTEKILSAKPLIKDKYRELKLEFEKLNKPLVLKVIRLGQDPASAFYVNNIVNQGERLGADVELVTLQKETTQQELVKLIEQFNQDDFVDGIMIQKPLPKHIDSSITNYLIKPTKDVDGFHTVNLGKLLLGQDGLFPCTATACVTMMKYYNIDPCCKHIVIIGRSNNVGKPLANMLLLQKGGGDATVTVCHSKTHNLKEITKCADILIAAIGQPKFVTKEHISDNCIVLDVGINQIIDENGKVKYVGDVDYEDVFDKVTAISPVPNGIGSVTTYELFKNLLKSRNIL